MVTYFRSVWQSAHPSAEVGPRNNTELELLAESIDLLLRGDLPALGDMLMQRFKAVQVASTKGWKLASELEVRGRDDCTLVSQEEMAEAERARLRTYRLEESIAKGKR